jgi:hypothetical protein
LNLVLSSNPSPHICFSETAASGAGGGAAPVAAPASDPKYVAAKAAIAVPKAEAVAALKTMEFMGPWHATFEFFLVDLSAAAGADADKNTVSERVAPLQSPSFS